MIKIFIGMLCFLILSCKSATPKPPQTDKPEIPQFSESEPLTNDGENAFPEISPDSQKVLFSSKGRQAHRHFQIYELSLKSNKSKRITYNDGETLRPGYIEGTDFIRYSSTTDEIKESPSLLQKKANSVNDVLRVGSHEPYLSYEVYSSSLDGERIERLTKHNGFDGFVSWEKPNSFFYISRDKDQFSIIKNTGGLNISLYRSAQIIADLKYSPSEESWIWIQLDINKTTSELVTAKKNIKNVSVVSLPAGYFKDPVWVNGMNQILVSAKLKEDSDFNIYHYDFNTKCLRKLVSNPGDDLTPAIDRKNSFIVFANKGPSGQHLYKKMFNEPNGACL